jgi:predicted phosphodiesterase
MSSKSPTAPIAGAIAVFSDIHGNLAALDAVLAELARRDVRHIYCAGDLLFGGAEPLEVWKRLTDAKVKCVRGTSDTALAMLDPDKMNPTTDEQKERFDRFRATRTEVGELVLRYLAKLPHSLRIPLVDGREIIVVHGSPADPTIEMSHDLSDDEMLTLLGDDPADIVCCGGSHVSFQRDVEGVRIIGLGSVGASPEGGVAHYTVLTPRLEGTVVEQEWVRWAPEA